jgi:hypothetical protein
VFPDTYPFPEESVALLVKDGIRAVMTDPFLSGATKLLLSTWFLVVGLFPRPIALAAIKARHVPLNRPRMVELALSLAGAVRR